MLVYGAEEDWWLEPIHWSTLWQVRQIDDLRFLLTRNFMLTGSRSSVCGSWQEVHWICPASSRATGSRGGGS
jgi:hypothetical protein